MVSMVMRSQLLGQAHKALVAAGVALPPPIREKTEALAGRKM
jgi:hypothetical protein